MKQDWALLIGFGLAITGCCGALAYVAAGGTEITFTLMAGLAFLAAAHILLLILMVRQGDSFHERMTNISRASADLRAEVRSKMEMALSRIQQVQSETRSRTDSMIGGISDLKTSYSDLRKSLAEQVANPPVITRKTEVNKTELVKTGDSKPSLRQVPVFEDPVPARSGETKALAERINFALEPVVDMRSRHTAHYRLHMSLPLGKVEVSGESLLEQVSRSGLRRQLDSVAVDEVLLLLSRLRQRDGDLCIIMPVGAETLADPKTVEHIAEAAHDAGPAGQGLVLELRHAMLPLLTPASLEGLAQLSRHGQAFALADAAPGALDLAAMKTLHVKMVGIDASEVMQSHNQQELIRFAQEARLHGIGSMITGVENPQLVARLTQITPLACGPCFASPRRVKRAHGETQDKHQKLVQAA